MSIEPRPLESGFQLAERFEIKDVLGRGGFGIAYLASDLVRGDFVVIKELAPHGIRRTPESVLEFQESIGSHLRERFLEEAGVLSHLNIKGVPPIRATFRENGTAYFATDFVPNASTLEDFLRRNGRLSSATALDIFNSLLDILDALHAKRILHRDIKPSNILIDKRGEIHLIDFGAAREWHADAVTSHTVFYTPGYAPPEQLSVLARRGPATDLYALCATMYVMLIGIPPPSASDRAAGIALPSVTSLRSDVDPVLARAIESGLSLAYTDRPQTVADLRDVLANVQLETQLGSLEMLDETLLRLKQFKFERRSCPSCGNLLTEPRPIRKNACPVCHAGTLKRRDINERLCPICRTGVLIHVKNQAPLSVCPLCRRGALSYKRKNLLTTEQFATCDACEARFDVRSNKMASMQEEGGDFRDFDSWRKQSGRAQELWRCPDCPAQFDVLPDGRWTQVIKGLPGKYQTLYPDEWARVAIGLEPGSGNAACEACGADYFLERNSLTLLDAHEDPTGFAANYLGRLISIDDVRWLAVGKTSPHLGSLCEHCHTEFDRDQDYLRLVTTSNKRLARHLDRPKKLADWHRIAQGLPTIDKEDEFLDTLFAVLRDSYRHGMFAFDNEGRLIWRGEAILIGESNSATLSITKEEMSFGGLLRRRKLPTDAIVGVWADEFEIHFQFSGAKEATGYHLKPITLTTRLASGSYKVTLDARDLAARLTFELKL